MPLVEELNDRGFNAAAVHGEREVEQEGGTVESGSAPLPVPTHTVIRIGA